MRQHHMVNISTTGENAIDRLPLEMKNDNLTFEFRQNEILFDQIFADTSNKECDLISK